MYYLIYQITNNINHMIYVGKHKTADKNDDYMGSGKYLKRDQKEMGIENFTKEILFELQSEAEMNAKEREIVNEDFVAREDTYNVAIVGSGGWDYVNYRSDYVAGTEKRRNAVTRSNHDDATNQRRSEAMYRWRKNMMETNPEKLKELDGMCGEYAKEYVRNQVESNPNYMKGENNPMFGRHHSESTCKVLSETHMGDKNNMYGRMWIFNVELGECKTIPSTEKIPYGWEKGRHSKKVLEQMKNGILPDKNRASREQYLKRKILKAAQMYKVYREEGFDAVVDKFNYSHSRDSLCRMFKKYVSEYVPEKDQSINVNITYANSVEDDKVLKELVKKDSDAERIEKLTEYYTLLYNAYLEHGFDYIVKTFGYTKTRENLSRKFKRYVKDYNTEALLKATVALRKKNSDYTEEIASVLHMTEDEKVDLYTRMYEDFKEKGFDFIVEKYNYKRTRGGLLWSFRKYVKGYVPNQTYRWNGKGANQNPKTE